jgi:hypothetical protein
MSARKQVFAKPLLMEQISIDTKKKLLPESVTPEWMQGVRACAGAPLGSPQFLGSKQESMACALRRYGVSDSGVNKTRLITVTLLPGSIFQVRSGE